MKVRIESEIAQSCPTLSDPMDYSLPGSSFHGIFQARVLEWGAIAFSKPKLSDGEMPGQALHRALTRPLVVRESYAVFQVGGWG